MHIMYNIYNYKSDVFLLVCIIYMFLKTTLHLIYLLTIVIVVSACPCHFSKIRENKFT